MWAGLILAEAICLETLYGTPGETTKGQDLPGLGPLQHQEGVTDPVEELVEATRQIGEPLKAVYLAPIATPWELLPTGQSGLPSLFQSLLQQELQ